MGVVGDGFSSTHVGSDKDAQRQRLIVRIANGDKAAFAALYETFAPRLYGYLRLQVTSDGDIEDVMQDTFVTVWRSASRYTGASSVDTWIFGIARHKLMDWMRAKYRQPPVLLSEPAFMNELSLTVEEDFADSVATTLSIEKALESLPPPYAEMFYLVYKESMSYKDIGALMGISEGTVKSRMYHAKLRLRQQLREEGTGVE